MDEVKRYLAIKTNDELVRIYEKDYKDFKDTGICTDGPLRDLINMVQKIHGVSAIFLAEYLFLQECSERFVNFHKNIK